MNENRDDFFIGWSNRLDKSRAAFLAIVGAALLIGFAAAAVALSNAITDPARSLIGNDALPEAPRDVTVVGVLTSDPYPLLLGDPDSSHPSGHGIMLAGDGKHAAAYDRQSLEGRRVEVKGLLLKRGALDMLVVSEPPKLVGNDPPATTGAREALGRWRVKGEICDGKCGAGIMSPGTGIAHKACASLCVIGGVPPVLVITQPLAGHGYLMIGNAQGRALDDTILKFVGMRIEIEGQVESRGDVALMRVEPAHLRRL